MQKGFFVLVIQMSSLPSSMSEGTKKEKPQDESESIIEWRDFLDDYRTFKIDAVDR